MASSPAEILGQGQALVPNAGEQMLREQMGRLQLQGAQLQNQAQAQQLQQAQLAFHRQQSFGHDMEAFISNPTAQGLASLYGRYPEFAKQSSDAWNALDEGRRRTDLTQIGSVAALTARGDYEGAAKLMETRIAADKAAGQDTASDEALLDHLRSPDEAQRKAALGMASIALAGAAGPEHASEFLKANGLSQEPVIRNAAAGDSVISIDPITHQSTTVYESPYVKGADGTLYERTNTPGASAGASSPTGARRIHGYTPRASNGGDNSDAVVDNKIAALSRAVGVDPDTPMTPEQFSAFVRALPATENAAGNNAGGIKDGAFARRQPGYAGAIGQYAKFATPEAGLAAMETLLRGSYYNRGQQSIRDIIEGRPVGGQATAPAPAGDAPPDLRVLVPGKQREAPSGYRYTAGGALEPIPGGPADKGHQYQVLSPQEVAQIPGLDPNTVYQRSPDGQITAVGGQSRSQLKPWPQTALAARTTNQSSITNIDRALALLDPRNKSKVAQTARNAIGPTTGAFGETFLNWHNPEGTDFRALIGQIGGVIIKDISGAAVSAAEDSRLSKWVPKVTDTPAVIMGKLRNLRREIEQKNQAMDDTYSEDQGFRPLHTQQPAPAAQGFRIVAHRPAR